MNARIYTFPTSILKMDRKKIRYHEFLLNGDCPDCTVALLKLYPIICKKMTEIKALIEETPYLTDLQKTFYRAYILARCEKILKPAYEKWSSIL